MIKRVVITVLLVIAIVVAIIFERPAAVGKEESHVISKIAMAVDETKNIKPEVEEVIVEEAEIEKEEIIEEEIDEEVEVTEEEYYEEPEEEYYEEPEEEYYKEPEEEYYEETYTGGMTYIGTFEMTAYEWTGNPCANGNYPTVGYTVACNSLSLGTQVYIDGIGYRTVEDRGASWHSDSWMDLYLGDVSSCYAFGRQYLDVYIVD